MRRNNSIGYVARLMTISYFFAFILLFVISVIKGLGAGDDQLWPQLSKITTSSLKGGAAGAMLGLFYWMLAEKFSWITGSINGAKRKWALSKLIRYCSILAFYFTLMIAVIHVILYFAKGGA
ncbi:hypothetical protein D3C80_570610 [compost metagenome]